MYVTNDQKAAIPYAFTADAAYPAGTRMKPSGTWGILTAAGDEAHIGTLASRTKASGDPVTLISKNASGAIAYVANGAVALGAEVSSVAGGKVQTGITGAIDLGFALNATSANGDSILVMPK
jgi:hypothetical protein